MKCVICGTQALNNFAENQTPISSFLGSRFRASPLLDMDGNGEISSEEKQRCTCTRACCIGSHLAVAPERSLVLERLEAGRVEESVGRLTRAIKVPP